MTREEREALAILRRGIVRIINALQELDLRVSIASAEVAEFRRNRLNWRKGSMAKSKPITRGNIGK